jgi:hypothetical protein
MTSHDPVELLREADPARRPPGVAAAPPLDLLERIVAGPPPPPRKRARRRLAVAAAAGIAAVAAAIALPLLLPADRADLLARAYAATAADEGVLYTELAATSRVPGQPPERTITRIWQSGDRSRRVRAVVDADGATRRLPGTDRPWIYEHVQDGGVLRTRLPEGGVQTIRESDGAAARGILARERTGLVERFRRRYAEGGLADAGATTFEGRPAHAYVAGGRGTMRETYFFDPASGRPLGSEIAGRGFSYSEVVRRFERLPSSPSSRARLSARWAR